jgi:N-methylhydantoinase A
MTASPSSNGGGHDGYVVGVDIGGTFTDAVVIAPTGRVHTGKVPTRPEDRARSFFESIEEAAAKFGMSLDQLFTACERVVHGTTTGTNALITRRGAEVGMLTTAGFRDMVHMMNGAGRLVGLSSDQITDPSVSDKPEPLIHKKRIREVVERVDFEGDVMVPLDEGSVRSAVAELRDQDVEAVCVSLLWSMRNDAHEQRVAEIVREEMPGAFVTTASELSLRVGEFQRSMTSLTNAYIGPLMRRYVDNIENGAQERQYPGRILYAQAAGGAITADEAREAPVRTVHSGPVSGTLGSSYLAARMGEPDLIVTDMGGTSFDVSIVRNSAPDVREVSLLERFEIALPMVYLDSIGAGGGSIAWIDDAGGLQVGPQSAGADPGPACYGRGGVEPTVTDADLVLGVLDPDNFLHGAMKLDREASERAIARVAEPLGLTVEEAAAGINQIIDSKMADLLRRMSVMRGLDPRDFVCFAYGGMGPTHAGSVAKDVGVKQLIVPLLHVAPVWSAFGAAIANVSHVYQRWEEQALPLDPASVNEIFTDLESRAAAQFRDEGFADGEIVLQRFVRMKYTAQAFDVEIGVGGGEITAESLATTEEDFHRKYAELHGEGAGYKEGGSRVTAFTVRGQGLTGDPHLSGDDEEGRPVERKARDVYWSEYGEFRSTPVLSIHGGSAVDDKLEGPMLIELPDTVVVLRPDQTARFDDLGSLLIDLG